MGDAERLGLFRVNIDICALKMISSLLPLEHR